MLTFVQTDHNSPSRLVEFNRYALMYAPSTREGLEHEKKGVVNKKEKEIIKKHIEPEHMTKNKQETIVPIKKGVSV
jgi:alpha-galactosidase/6-phospho-beta-glucosidase family protein